MDIKVSIAGVDGETNLSLSVTGGKARESAEAFLKQHDHEGSSVAVSVTAHGQHAYELLKRLKDPEPPTFPLDKPFSDPSWTAELTAAYLRGPNPVHWAKVSYRQIEPKRTCSIKVDAPSAQVLEALVKLVRDNAESGRVDILAEGVDYDRKFAFVPPTFPLDKPFSDPEWTQELLMQYDATEPTVYYANGTFQPAPMKSTYPMRLLAPSPTALAEMVAKYEKKGTLKINARGTATGRHYDSSI